MLTRTKPRKPRQAETVRPRTNRPGHERVIAALNATICALTELADDMEQDPDQDGPFPQDVQGALWTAEMMYTIFESCAIPKPATTRHGSSKLEVTSDLASRVSA